ncbi:DUF7123 family protein [Haloarcula rubra]
MGEEIGLSAKEVGVNMTALEGDSHGIRIEKWGYSTSKTWMVEI